MVKAKTSPKKPSASPVKISTSLFRRQKQKNRTPSSSSSASSSHSSSPPPPKKQKTLKNTPKKLGKTVKNSPKTKLTPKKTVKNEPERRGRKKLTDSTPNSPTKKPPSSPAKDKPKVKKTDKKVVKTKIAKEKVVEKKNLRGKKLNSAKNTKNSSTLRKNVKKSKDESNSNSSTSETESDSNSSISSQSSTSTPPKSPKKLKKDLKGTPKSKKLEAKNSKNSEGGGVKKLKNTEKNTKTVAKKSKIVVKKGGRGKLKRMASLNAKAILEASLSLEQESKEKKKQLRAETEEFKPLTLLFSEKQEDLVTKSPTSSPNAGKNERKRKGSKLGESSVKESKKEVDGCDKIKKTGVSSSSVSTSISPFDPSTASQTQFTHLSPTQISPLSLPPGFSIGEESYSSSRGASSTSTPVSHFGPTVYQPAGPLIEPHKNYSSSMHGLLPDSVRIPSDLKVTYQTHPPPKTTQPLSKNTTSTTTPSTKNTSTPLSKNSTSSTQSKTSSSYTNLQSKTSTSNIVSKTSSKKSDKKVNSGKILHQPYRSSTTSSTTTTDGVTITNLGGGRGVSGSVGSSGSLSSSGGSGLISSPYTLTSGSLLTPTPPSAHYYNSHYSSASSSPFAPSKYPIVPPDSYRVGSPYSSGYPYAPPPPSSSLSGSMSGSGANFYMSPTGVYSPLTRPSYPNSMSGSGGLPVPSPHPLSSYYPQQTQHHLGGTPSSATLPPPGHAGPSPPNPSSHPACLLISTTSTPLPTPPHLTPCPTTTSITLSPHHFHPSTPPLITRPTRSLLRPHSPAIHISNSTTHPISSMLNSSSTTVLNNSPSQHTSSLATDTPQHTPLATVLTNTPKHTSVLTNTHPKHTSLTTVLTNTPKHTPLATVLSNTPPQHTSLTTVLSNTPQQFGSITCTSYSGKGVNNSKSLLTTVSSLQSNPKSLLTTVTNLHNSRSHLPANNNPKSLLTTVSNSHVNNNFKASLGPAKGNKSLLTTVSNLANTPKSLLTTVSNLHGNSKTSLKLGTNSTKIGPITVSSYKNPNSSSLAFDNNSKSLLPNSTIKKKTNIKKGGVNSSNYNNVVDLSLSKGSNTVARGLQEQLVAMGVVKQQLPNISVSRLETSPEISIKKTPLSKVQTLNTVVKSTPFKSVLGAKRECNSVVDDVRKLENAKSFTEQYSLPDDITITPIIMSASQSSALPFYSPPPPTPSPKKRDIVHVIDPRSGETTTIAKHMNKNITTGTINNSLLDNSVQKSKIFTPAPVRKRKGLSLVECIDGLQKKRLKVLGDTNSPSDLQLVNNNNTVSTKNESNLGDMKKEVENLNYCKIIDSSEAEEAVRALLLPPRKNKVKKGPLVLFRPKPVPNSPFEPRTKPIVLYRDVVSSKNSLLRPEVSYKRVATRSHSRKKLDSSHGPKLRKVETSDGPKLSSKFPVHYKFGNGSSTLTTANNHIILKIPKSGVGLGDKGSMISGALRKRAGVVPSGTSNGLASPLPVHTHPRWSNGWRFEGKAYEAKVYINNDDSPVLRRCYAKMVHDCGDIIQSRDCVLLKSGPKKTDLPFVAKVSALWENPSDGEMMFSLLWYYRPEHTYIGRSKEDMPDEIFASRHRDSNSVATIEDKCYVFTLNEYCRYKKRLKQLSENVPEGLPIVPLCTDATGSVAPVSNYATDVATAVWFGISKKTQNSNEIPSNNSEENDNGSKTTLNSSGKISPDSVFFCRRAYDYRQKRMFRNI